MPGHSHSHSHGCSSHGAAVAPRTLAVAVGVSLAFVLAEAAAGWLAGSLALLSDAGHNLADVGALALSWYAVVVARKPSHHGMTFGYHRVGVLAALVNGVSLVVIAVGIVWAAIVRLQAPAAADSRLMIIVALGAIVVNVVVTLQLREGAKHDMNVRSAYIHMIGDALASLGVVIAGVVVAATGSTLADPLVSLVIAGFILWTSIDIIRDSATVLLEGTPRGTDLAAVTTAIGKVTGVLDVHDLHVWMVGPGLVACSCHIVVADLSAREGQQVHRGVIGELARLYHITHTTVQVEVDRCDANQLPCMTSSRPDQAPDGDA